VKNLVDASRKVGMTPEHIMWHAYVKLSERNPTFTALDGGSHKGYHAKRLADLPNCRKVFAVEASSEWAQRLAEQRRPNIQVINAAIQDDPACNDVVFKLSPSHPGRSGIMPIWIDDPAVTYVDVSVPATTIDRICEGEKIDYIKLDLEGGEFRALKGAVNTMATGRPWMTFENSRRAPETGGYTLQEFRDFFTRAGYVAMTLWGEDFTPENQSSFWYAAAAPIEQRDAVSAALFAATSRVLYT
jgi:FkbM family methyltransferase